MNNQPFITLLRYPFILILLVYATTLSAQVPATVQFPRSAQAQAHLIHVQWKADAEQQWKSRFDDRFDKMGLKTNLHSQDMANTRSTEFRFHMQEGMPSAIECLITNEALAVDETIQLVDILSGEVIVDFHNQASNRFVTPAFDPSKAKLVWTYGRDEVHNSQFTIETIYYAKGDSRTLDIGFGTSLACHPNAACKPDSMSVLISNTTVRIRIVTEEGSGYCTGALVNNTRNDKTPYLLTSYHCQWNATPLYDQWRFDFDYRAGMCPNPANEPQFFSLTGCELISSGQGSDYLLVRLDQPIPDNKQVTFAGWNRDDVNTADTIYHVHHPNADIRKFSTSTNKATVHPNSINWSEGYTTPANHHIHFEFTEGGHEPGSSGGPVFDQDGLLVGQLHGGSGGCETAANTFVGRFSKSWNSGSTPQTRLRDWLDPDNTGVMTWSNLPNIVSADLISIEGVIVDPKGNPCVNAKVTINGSSTNTFYTDAQGRFQLTGVDRHGTYVITPEKNSFPTNGLNVLDVLAIQKHSLAKDTFDFPWQHIAADATNNQEISVGDMLQITRLLLGKITVFTSSPSWRFDPPVLTFSDLPAGETTRAQFTAIKIGDVNGTADPSQ